MTEVSDAYKSTESIHALCFKKKDLLFPMYHYEKTQQVSDTLW